MNMFPSNKLSEFTARLDNPIEIHKESWKVALVEIATPSEVLNITEENDFFFLAFPDQHSLYTKFGVENITEMCSNDNDDYYKLFYCYYSYWRYCGTYSTNCAILS